MRANAVLFIREAPKTRESWDQIPLALVLQAWVRLDWGEQGADDVHAHQTR